MHLRAAWCAFPIPLSASATSTHSSKRTASPVPSYPPCLSYPPSSLTLPSACPPSPLNCTKSSLRSDSLRSPEISPKLWLSFCPKALRVQLAPGFPASPRAFQTSHRSSPSFPAERNNTSSTSRTASIALCLKMPKKQQQQQKQKHDKNQHDVELSQLIRHSPLPPPLRSRSPSPSSPNGSTLELPNVPSYPRLPPIVSPPSKQLSSLSRQLSGLSNPAFFIEDDSAVSAVRGESEQRKVNCVVLWDSLEMPELSVMKSKKSSHKIRHEDKLALKWGTADCPVICQSLEKTFGSRKISNIKLQTSR